MSTRYDREQRARVRALRNEHHTLARQYVEARERVGEYTGRRFLSPSEELECKALQRIKLHKKDALAQVTRELSRLEQSLEQGRRQTS